MSQNVSLCPGQIEVEYGRRKVILQTGWIGTPNVRGTIDVIWACGFTIFLCSWSILCLNLPAHGDGFWRQARRKFQWTLLAIFGPEVVFQLSLGEWIVARKWVKKFREDGYTNWTMTHSFYANMGGFVLHTTDQGNFPINSAQLHHLLKGGYVTYPKVEKRAILDKNKAEAVVRCLTLGQTLWFVMNSIGRAAQHLTITTLELSTLAFISSAIGTCFCWFHKPMDVETSVTIFMDTPVAEVQNAAGFPNDNWTKTPLDFIERRREWPWNLYWHYGFAFARKKLKLGWFFNHPQQRPIERIADDYWPEPTVRSLPALFVFHTSYAAILISGWNLDLPTYTELKLWRIASCIQMGTIVSAWLTMPLQIHDVPPRLRRLMAFAAKKREQVRGHVNLSGEVKSWYDAYPFSQQLRDRAERARTLVSEDENWRASLRLLVVYEVTVAIYLFARLYIIVEDLASLRAMPPSAFETVNWSLYLPHI